MLFAKIEMGIVGFLAKAACHKSLRAKGFDRKETSIPGCLNLAVMPISNPKCFILRTQVAIDFGLLQYFTPNLQIEMLEAVLKYHIIFIPLPNQ